MKRPTRRNIERYADGVWAVARDGDVLNSATASQQIADGIEKAISAAWDAVESAEREVRRIKKDERDRRAKLEAQVAELKNHLEEIRKGAKPKPLSCIMRDDVNPKLKSDSSKPAAAPLAAKVAAVMDDAKNGCDEYLDLIMEKGEAE